MRIETRKSIFNANERQASLNQEKFLGLGLLAINILASPGAGKTRTILRLLKELSAHGTVGVIEGDVASSIDTEKVRSMGFAATQINTGGGCHLDATMIDRAIDALGVRGPGFLFIENIGNLICPAEFNLGERLRMVIASVPEGDDKPIKYPGIFSTADAIVLNKMDLVSMVEFSLESFVTGVRAVNPSAPIFNISARTGEGVGVVVDWLLSQAKG